MRENAHVRAADGRAGYTAESINPIAARSEESRTGKR